MTSRSARVASASGRFLLRLPASLHARLQAAAKARRCSLNDYCARRLAVPGSTWLAEDGARTAVERVLDLLGPRLVGIVLYGSIARGESTPSSDVDLLIVVDDAIPITRQIYRQWDGAPVAWMGRPVNPHFVRLPKPGLLKAGAWCEAAIDGVVLCERDGALTRHLAALRGAIAAGRLVRRSVHGQPYWTVAA